MPAYTFPIRFNPAVPDAFAIATDKHIANHRLRGSDLRHTSSKPFIIAHQALFGILGAALFAHAKKRLVGGRRLHLEVGVIIVAWSVLLVGRRA